MSINFYEKNNAYILNEIESLGMYECLFDEYSSFEVKGVNSIFLRDGLRIIELLNNDYGYLSDSEVYYSRYEIVFYDLANGTRTQQNRNGQYVSLLFDSKQVFEVIKKLNPFVKGYYDYFNNKNEIVMDQSILENEITGINTLLTTLEKLEGQEILIKFNLDH